MEERRFIKKKKPKGFNECLKDTGKSFLGGVWQGMGPNPMIRNKKKRREVE